MGGKIFVVILGAIILLMGLFLLFLYMRIIFNNKCYEAKIIGMNLAGTSRGIPTYLFEISFNDNEDLCVNSLNRVMGFSPFEKRQFKRFQKKYIGKSVNVYYNPNNPNQTIIKEYIWKEIMISAFVIALGSLLIILGCLSTP